MSAQSPIPSSQDISSTAKVEGGPQKGSDSAQMQSQVGKAQVGFILFDADQVV